MNVSPWNSNSSSLRNFLFRHLPRPEAPLSQPSHPVAGSSTVSVASQTSTWPLGSGVGVPVDAASTVPDLG